MSNSNPNEYEYIKALVRGLHIQKNVSRPDTALLSPNPFNDEPDTTSITEDDDDDYDRRLPTVAESSAASSRRGSELRLSKNELTRLRKQHKQTLRLNKKSPPPQPAPQLPLQIQRHQTPIHHRSNHSLNIPSVVVTGANEHTDLLTTTQRRFSQLYSGLRRFSTSHTVGDYFSFEQIADDMCACVHNACVLAHTHARTRIMLKMSFGMRYPYAHTHTYDYTNIYSPRVCVCVCV